MPHLEDVFFGRREEADVLFNDYLTLQHALNLARGRAFEVLRSEHTTLFASVRLYEQPFIASYSVPVIIAREGNYEVMRLPVKKISPKAERDPTFFFAMGNPEDLGEQMYYIVADISRAEEITRFEAHQASSNGVKGSIDEWCHKMMSAYIRITMLNNDFSSRSFEKLYLTYFKNGYYLSMCVKDNPLIDRLHVHPDGRIAWSGKDRQHKSLIAAKEIKDLP